MNLASHYLARASAFVLGAVTLPRNLDAAWAQLMEREAQLAVALEEATAQRRRADLLDALYIESQLANERKIDLLTRAIGREERLRYELDEALGSHWELCRDLTAEQHEQVQHFADLLRAGPVDMEVLGRETHRAYWSNVDGTIPYSWDSECDEHKDQCRAVGKDLYRLGQASGDSRLREAVRDFVQAWVRNRVVDINAAFERLTSVLAEGPEPLQAATPPTAEMAVGGVEQEPSMEGPGKETKPCTAGIGGDLCERTDSHVRHIMHTKEGSQLCWHDPPPSSDVSHG